MIIADLSNQTGIEIFTPNTDLNDYKTPGVYYFNGNNTPKNIPFGVNGWLRVMTSKDQIDVIKQIWYRHGSVGTCSDTATRTYFDINKTWSAWSKYAMTTI